jgi:hypothetical protein
MIVLLNILSISDSLLLILFNSLSADSDDDDSIPDLHERLINVDLDDSNSVWEKLTLAERQEFENLLQSGDASQLVAQWEPWWLYRLD